MDKLRLDKWLWCVRLFKSRTQATAACRSGRVKYNGECLKASSPVELGMVIEVRKNGFNFTYRIEQLINNRVSAPLAMACYTNLTPAFELLKYEQWYAVQKQTIYRERGSGRPTKKERREMDLFFYEE